MRRSLTLGVLALSGCVADVTAVMVEIDAESAIASDTTSLELTVSGGPREGPLETRRTTSVESSELHWPFYVSIAPRDGDATRRFGIIATASSAGTAIGRVRAFSGFREGRVLLLRLVLDASCRDIAPSCGDDETCARGGCVSATVDPATLPDYTGRVGPDADRLDSGRLDVHAPRDSGGPDAACRLSAECDDRNDCTEDRCESGACVHFDENAPGVRCDDGNECTTNDLCVPDEGRCEGNPACDDGNACTHSDLCTVEGACAGIAYTCPGGTTPPQCDGAGGCTCPAELGRLCSIAGGDPRDGCYPQCCPGEPDRPDTCGCADPARHCGTSVCADDGRLVCPGSPCCR